MMKIVCKFCTWQYEFPTGLTPRAPSIRELIRRRNEALAIRDTAMYEAGRHYERCHSGMFELMAVFDRRLEDLALLPDTRTEVPR